MKHRLSCLFVIGLVLSASYSGSAQTSAFTYQGKFTDASAAQPTNGTYNMQFALFDTPGAGTQIGSTVTNPTVNVTNGIFTVTLAFDTSSFSGADRYLEIRVFNPSTSAYVSLSPRQQVTSAPYSIKSLVADSATNAVNATNAATANNSLNLGNVAANQYVQTNDSRLSDARTPTAGSSFYIQNQNSAPQASSDFNISGIGKASAFDAGTEFRIGGNRVLAAPVQQNTYVGLGAGSVNTGGFNTFVGNNAGNANTTGQQNSFFGADSGKNTLSGIRNSFFGYSSGMNTVGSDNSFFGDHAGDANLGGTTNSFFGSASGLSNSTGTDNSFFGVSSGRNTTAGNRNAFFGRSAGSTNTSGENNSFFGVQSGLGNTIGFNNTLLGSGTNVGTFDLGFATAIGSGAVVSTSNTVVIGRNLDTVQIPGGLNVTGTLTASGAGLTNLNASNITSGTLNNARLGVVPIANGGTGSATQNFVDLTTTQNVGGSKTFSATTRVTNGASGGTAIGSVDLIVEDNAAAFQHFLTPDDNESGILFGDVTDSIAGGIVFNNAATNNGMHFRTGGNTTRMTFNGSGQLGIGVNPTATLHVGGAGGNGSVILPSDAIGSAEIVDEPGVASAADATGVPMGASVGTLLSRSITVPAAGYVMVVGTLQASVTHTTGTASSANFGVSDAAGSFPANQNVSYVLASALPSSSYSAPITVHGLFDVTAGSHTFFLLGEENTGSFVANARQLTLLYIPTAYGTVTPTLASMQDATSSDGSKEASVETPTRTRAISDNGSSRPTALLTELQTQIELQNRKIEDLRAVVCALKPNAAVCKE